MITDHISTAVAGLLRLDCFGDGDPDPLQLGNLAAAKSARDVTGQGGMASASAGTRLMLVRE